MADVATLSIKADIRDLRNVSTELKQLVGQSQKTDRATSKLERSFVSMGKGLKTVGIAAGAFSAAVVAAGVAVGSKAIQMSSDLEETQGKFNVVFRGMTKEAEMWSETLVNAYAMSETESKKYLSGIQDLLVPTGLAREEAGKLSNQFVKMAADLGSFNNLPTQKVIEDIQSALQGSSETMAKYGINVKAAKVEQEILNSGLAASKAEITDAHKAQAIYNIIMRDGADAVGDMARTQESFANQQKKALANVDDFTTILGERLLPLATDAVTAFNEWFKTNGKILAQDLAGWLEKGAIAVKKTIDFFMELDDFFAFMIGNMLMGWERFKHGFELGVLGIKSSFFLAFDAIQEKSADVIGEVVEKLSMLPLVGEKIASGLSEAEKSLRGASTATEDFQAEVDKLNKHHKAQIDILKKVQDEIFEYEKVGTQAEKKVQEAAKKTAIVKQQTSEKTIDILLKNQKEYDKATFKSATDIKDMWLVNEKEKSAASKRASKEIISIEDNKSEYLKDAANEVVRAVIAGEDVKVAVASMASEKLINYAVDAATTGLTQIFQALGGQIGAWVGLGVAESSTDGTTWQQKLASAAGYLAGAGAAVLAGKAVGDSFSAEGGWLGANPTGGIIKQGSGTRDDVFLGFTNGGLTRNWGMGGEFVVNKKATAKHAPLLMAINNDNFAEGGPIREPMSVAEDINDSGFDTFWKSVIATRGDWRQAIIESIAYYGGTMAGMVAGKKIGPNLFADGGIVEDRNFGFGGFFKKLTDPFGISKKLKKVNKLLDPFGLQDKLLKKGFGAVWDTLRDLPIVDKYVERADKILYPFVRDTLIPGKSVTSGTAHDMIKGMYEGLAKELGDVVFGVPGVGDLIGSFRGGLDYVPRDGLAYVHEGERITPANYNMSNDSLVSEIKALRRDMYQIARNTMQSANYLKKFDQDGLPSDRGY